MVRAGTVEHGRHVDLLPGAHLPLCKQVDYALQAADFRRRYDMENEHGLPLISAESAGPDLDLPRRRRLECAAGKNCVRAPPGHHLSTRSPTHAPSPDACERTGCLPRAPASGAAAAC